MPGAQHMRDEGTRVVTAGESEKGGADMKKHELGSSLPVAKIRDVDPLRSHTVWRGLATSEDGRLP